MSKNIILIRGGRFGEGVIHRTEEAREGQPAISAPSPVEQPGRHSIQDGPAASNVHYLPFAGVKGDADV